MEMKTGAEQPLELDGKPVQEPIFIRRGRLKSLFNGVGGKSAGRMRGQELDDLTSDVLLDSFLVLYDEFRASNENEKDDYYQFFVNKYAKSFAAVKNNLVNANDFTFGGLIGHGRFGQVRIAREDRSGRVYAAKILDKSDSLVQKTIPSLDNELNILSSARSPWLASLKYSFHSPDNLYFVMEYIPGGDFNSVMRLTDGKMSEESTRFYMAELVLAIEGLHSFGYAHRDIRPENILLDRLGHIKLVDFGSSAKIGKSNKVMGLFNLGSPTYVAPEILQSLEDDDERLKLEDFDGKYGPGCDYWSLGVLAYECMFGITPFAGPTDIQTFQNIISFKTSLTIPGNSGVSPDFISLLNELLTVEADRIGYTKLLRHPFFHTIIWDAMRNEIPPYLPIVAYEDDLSNFQSQRKAIVPAAVPSKEKLSTKAFIGFTRTMFDAGSRNGLNASMNISNATLNTTWAENSADSSFYQKDDLGNIKNNSILQAKTDLASKVEIIEEKSAEIDSLKSKLEILSALNAEKDCKIGSLSSQVKRLQCEKEITLKELEEERETRRNVELMTTDLVTNVKASQQKKMSDLQNEAALQRKQIADRQDQLEDYHKVLTNLREENMKLKSDLEHSTSVKNGEKFLRNSRQSVRQSMSVLESRLNLSNAEWESRIQELQVKHSLELESTQQSTRKQELEFQEIINRYKSELNSLIGRLEESRKAREATLAELNQLYKENDILKIESQQKLIELNNQLLAAQKERNAKFEETFSVLETELEETKHERDNMNIRIEALVEETQLKEVQIQSLSQIVGRLEQSIASVEKCRSDFEVLKQSQENFAGGFECAERILQEQLSRAQDSLEKSMALNCEEIQKSRTLEQKLVSLEKEFTVTKVDLKILQRDKKDADSTVERLQSEKSQAQNTLKNLEEEKSLLEIKMGCIEGEVLDLQSKLGNRERDLNEATEIMDDLKENQNRINREYDELAAELFHSQSKLLDYEQLRISLDDRAKEMQKKDDSLNEKDRMIDHLSSNVQHLKDVVDMLDNQLKDLDNIIAMNNDETSKFHKVKITLELQNAKLEDELMSVQCRFKEMKERKSYESRQLSDLSAALKSEESRREKEVCSLTEKVEDLKESNEILSFRLAEMEGNLEELGVTKDNLKTSVETLKTENLKLNEESSRLIKQIVKTKELNITYSAALEEAVNKIEIYRDALAEKTETVASLEAEKADIETRFRATFSQHKKIIELLSDMKMDKNSAFNPRKKKTLFSGRIFGRSEKEKEEQNVNLERDLINLLCAFPMRSPEFKRANTDPLSICRHGDLKSPISTAAFAGGIEAVGTATVSSPLTPSRFIKCDSNSNGPISTSTPTASPAFESPKRGSTSSFSGEPSAAGCTPTSMKLHPILEEEAEEEKQLMKTRNLKARELLKLRALQKHQQQQRQIGADWPIETETETDDQDLDHNAIYLESRVALAPTNPTAVFKTVRILEANKVDDVRGQSSTTGMGQIYTVKEMTKDVYLIGSEVGLFSRKLSDVRLENSVQIEGVGSVYQLEFILSHNLVVLIEGPSRRLISIAYGMLEACAKAASCSKPEVGFGQEELANLEGVSVFRVQKKEDKSGSYVIAVMESKIVVLDRIKDSFVVKHKLQTLEMATCLLTTARSAFFACPQVYVLHFENNRLQEFIDDEETVSYSTDLATVAILDVGRSNLTSGETVYAPEYLICFSDFAVFVDGYGRRSRSEPIAWTKVPLALEYSHPNLYVTHFNSLEVIRLDPSSYTKTRVVLNRDSIGKEVPLIPESQFLPLTNPRIVGSSSRSSSTSIFVVAEEKLKEFVLDVNIEVPMELYSEYSSVFEVSSSSGRSIASCGSQRTSVASSDVVVSGSNGSDAGTGDGYSSSTSTTATDYNEEAAVFERGTRGFMGRLPVFVPKSKGGGDHGPQEPKPKPSVPLRRTAAACTAPITDVTFSNGTSSSLGKGVLKNGNSRSPQKPSRIRFAQPPEK